MTDTARLKTLSIVLILTGVTFIVGLPMLMFVLWPSGWSWHTGHSDYPLMIIGVYATLGVFLLAAARDPLSHLSLIRFTAWSSVVHGLIMAVQSFENATNHAHLMGDVPALIIVGVAMLVLIPREQTRIPARRAA
jgi:hypothetical protein